MGWKYEVHEYAFVDNGYRYVPRYEGDSIIVALWKCWRLHRNGAGCVKLEIR